MRKRKIGIALVAAIILLPLWMWLCWLLTPKKRMVVAIIDKTVLNREAQEHISLDWVLRHEKYTGYKGRYYRPDHDYFGFFPGVDDRFSLKGLERFPPEKLQQLSEDADMVYFTDTYGIYSNEWYKKRQVAERSGIVYGGMTSEDLELLADMKARHKLMIAEFNTIGSPTAAPVRTEFEKMFGMRWTGWTGRYFSDLDTARNKELPQWLTTNFIRQHGGKWPFHHAGIAFVSNSDQVVILEEGSTLTDPLPLIESTGPGRASLHIPTAIQYPFWFDIIAASAQNEVAANFLIRANAQGRAELDRYGIPARFPAVSMHRGSDYRFYYFSGDFCDNPIGIGTSSFNGIAWFSALLYDSSDPAQRQGFFWNFYRPMMTAILRDNFSSMPKR